MSTTARRIVYGTDLAVTPEQAFAVVSDPRQWPRFFVGMVSADIDDDWGRVGGHARMVNRFLGARMATEIEILEWDPPQTFRYRGTQPGRPDTDNLRSFQALPAPPAGPGGTRLHGTSLVVPRRGALGLLDHLSIRVLQRVFDRGMARLTQVVAEPGATDTRWPGSPEGTSGAQP